MGIRMEFKTRIRMGIGRVFGQVMERGSKGYLDKD